MVGKSEYPADGAPDWIKNNFAKHETVKDPNISFPFQ